MNTVINGLTARPLRIRTASAAATAKPFEHVICDVTGGSFTLTMPTAAINDIVYATLGTASGSNIVTLGGTTDGVLYVAGDFMGVQWDGSAWRTIADGRKPHSCRLRRSTAQSIDSATNVKVLLATEDHDTGAIGDPTTNNRIDIRRAGNYVVTAISGITGIDDGEQLYTEVYVNGVLRFTSSSYSPGADKEVIVSCSAVLSLAASDYLELYLFHTEGAAVNTSTVLYIQPTLSVAEIR